MSNLALQYWRWELPLSLPKRPHFWEKRFVLHLDGFIWMRYLGDHFTITLLKQFRHWHSSVFFEVLKIRNVANKRNRSLEPRGNACVTPIFKSPSLPNPDWSPNVSFWMMSCHFTQKQKYWNNPKYQRKPSGNFLQYLIRNQGNVVGKHDRDSNLLKLLIKLLRY